jgi:hypothetical protein
MADGRSMTVADVVAKAMDGRLVAPMSSMKGRVLSNGDWPFLTFVRGIGVVIIEIRWW